MFIGLDEVEEQIKEMGFINIDLGYLKAVMTDDKFIIEFSEDIMMRVFKVLSKNARVLAKIMKAINAVIELVEEVQDIQNDFEELALEIAEDYNEEIRDFTETLFEDDETDDDLEDSDFNVKADIDSLEDETLITRDEVLEEVSDKGQFLEDPEIINKLTEDIINKLIEDVAESVMTNFKNLYK
jgi:seryl-tRNA synthetase